MGIGDLLKTAKEQILPQGNTSTSVTTREPQEDFFFTRNFFERAKAWGLSESHARDVYNNGYTVKDNMMVRKYNGYEIGIYVFRAKDSGKIVITSIWKRARR